MKDHPTPCVCHEPEPVACAWAKIRDELGIYVLHHDRQRVFDIVAHELAEQQRDHAEAEWPGDDQPSVLRRVVAAHVADLIAHVRDPAP